MPDTKLSVRDYGGGRTRYSTVSMVGHGWLFMSSIGDNFVTGDKIGRFITLFGLT